jgi:CheY-specific phosphatase CheX
MNDFHKDVLIGLMFSVGILGFISGEFIVSSTLFAASAISSNVLMNSRSGNKSR